LSYLQNPIIASSAGVENVNKFSEDGISTLSAERTSKVRASLKSLDISRYAHLISVALESKDVVLVSNAVSSLLFLLENGVVCNVNVETLDSLLSSLRFDTRLSVADVLGISGTVGADLNPEGLIKMMETWINGDKSLETKQGYKIQTIWPNYQRH
jgi:hypothetical protein